MIFFLGTPELKEQISTNSPLTSKYQTDSQIKFTISTEEIVDSKNLSSYQNKIGGEGGGGDSDKKFFSSIKKQTIPNA